MNIVLGILFLWAAWEHLQDAINPDRLTRTRVRINSTMMFLVLCMLVYFNFKVAGILP